MKRKLRSRKRLIIVVSVVLAVIVATVLVFQTYMQNVTRQAAILMERPQQRPVFVLNVDPDPQAVIQQSPDKVRVDIQARPPLLKPGDFLSTVPVRLTVDGIPIVSDITVIAIDIAYVLYDDTGEIIASGPFEDQMSWEIPEFDVGIHIATLAVRSSDGERFIYSWAFEVTE